MKMDNNKNNNINNNVDDSVINFSEYINLENELSEEMLQAYLDATDMETPDLWNRIDEGYALELQQIKQEEIKERKKRNKKLFTVLAVAGVLLVIGTPVLFFGMGNVRDLTGDKSINDESEIVMDETVGEDADEDVQMESEAVNESEMTMDEAPMEETVTAAPVEEVPGDYPDPSVSSDPVYNTAAIISNSFVYENGRYVICVEEVIDTKGKDYGLNQGDHVVADNTEEVTALLQELGIYAEGKSYYDYGEFFVFMYMVDYYEVDEEDISHKVIVVDFEEYID